MEVSATRTKLLHREQEVLTTKAGTLLLMAS